MFNNNNVKNDADQQAPDKPFAMLRVRLCYVPALTLHSAYSALGQTLRAGGQGGVGQVQKPLCRLRGVDG